MTKIEVNSKEEDWAPPSWATHSLVIDKDNLEKLFVLGLNVDLMKGNALQNSLISYSEVTYQNFHNFLNFLDNAFVCLQNPEEKYIKMARKWKKTYFSKWVHSQAVTYKAKLHQATIHSAKCELIVSDQDRRCQSWAAPRKTLVVC